MREALRDKSRIGHMLFSIDLLLKYAISIDEEHLLGDRLRYYGIVKNIEMIGEAAYLLSREFKAANPQVEWAKIVTMRHILVHEYYNINPREVYQVLQFDLIPLKEQLESIYKHL